VLLSALTIGVILTLRNIGVRLIRLDCDIVTGWMIFAKEAQENVSGQLAQDSSYNLVLSGFHYPKSPVKLVNPKSSRHLGLLESIRTMPTTRVPSNHCSQVNYVVDNPVRISYQLGQHADGMPQSLKRDDILNPRHSEPASWMDDPLKELCGIDYQFNVSLNRVRWKTGGVSG